MKRLFIAIIWFQMFFLSRGFGSGEISLQGYLKAAKGAS